MQIYTDSNLRAVNPNYVSIFSSENMVSREFFFKYLFMPLSWAFHVCLILRKKAYQIGLFKIYKAKCPVVVIGNITIGGTGKTPITIWLKLFYIKRI